ncbi:MAG TPA: 50S ribosomal protein L6 [Chloroflexia bacterium]|nr:50S ribosomal protein L6 [Chloroflexia bacterium]
MSRIGKLPIPVPKGVDIRLDANNEVTVKGPKGTLTQTFHPDLQIAQQDGTLQVQRTNDDGFHRSLHGLTRSLLANMVQGVTTGYTKTLEISGVGYRVAKEGSDIVLALGFSHPVRVSPPPGITFTIEGNTRLHVAGIDKQLVGEEAAKIRRIRKPEPYKGKGIAYAGERIRRKAGKTGKTGKGKK